MGREINVYDEVLIFRAMILAGLLISIERLFIFYSDVIEPVTFHVEIRASR